MVLAFLLRHFSFFPCGDPTLDGWETLQRITTKLIHPTVRVTPVGRASAAAAWARA